VSREEPVRAGERVRLRLVNCSLARIMALRFEGHHPLVIAIDGQPCDPHEPDGGRILLGPAMRVDLDPGRRYRVIDDFYEGLSYWLTRLAYDQRQPLRGHGVDPPLVLPRNPLPEPDLTTSERHELILQGGMMGGGAMMGMGGMIASTNAIRNWRQSSLRTPVTNATSILPRTPSSLLCPSLTAATPTRTNSASPSARYFTLRSRRSCP